MLKRIGVIFLVVTLALVGIAMFNINGRQVDPKEYFSDPQTIALAEAMMAGDTGKMAELVAQGADPNARGMDGMSLLEWEMLRDGHSAMRELLRLGADPNLLGWHDSTPMHLAAQYLNETYLKLMLEHGGDADVVDGKMGRTPIFSALSSRRPDNIRLLLDNGATLDFADRDGIRPLKLAASINDFQHVLDFLRRGAEPRAVDNIGTTFQTSLFRSDPALLNVDALAARNAIIAFLEAEGIPLDPNARR